MSKYVYHAREKIAFLFFSFFSFFLLFSCSSYPAAQKERKKHIDKERKKTFSNNREKKYTAYETNRNYFKAKKGAGSARFDGRAEENR